MMTFRHATGARPALAADIEAIGEQVVDSAYHVYGELGPGMLERVYRVALADEIRSRGLAVDEELYLPVSYKSRMIDAGLRLDLRVEGRVVVEVKSVERLHPIYTAQMLTYLRVSGCQLGFIVNFGAGRFPAAVRRFINTKP